MFRKPGGRINSRDFSFGNKRIKKKGWKKNTIGYENIREVATMGHGLSSTCFTGERDDLFKYHQRGRNKVLLREPERCWECARVYISLYPLKLCLDHDGLEEI